MSNPYEDDPCRCVACGQLVAKLRPDSDECDECAQERWRSIIESRRFDGRSSSTWGGPSRQEQQPRVTF